MCHESVKRMFTDKHVSIGEERRVYLESVFEREARSVASRSGTFIDSSGDGRGRRGGVENFERWIIERREIGER